MNAEARVQGTQAEQGLIEQFAALKASGESSADILAVREKAFGAFEAAGLPHRRVEDWHYTDLRSKMRTAFPIKEAKSGGVLNIERLNACVFTLENGRLNEALSSFGDLEQGVIVRPMSKALAAQTPEAFGTVATQDDALVNLNTAFMQDGLAIRVKDGVKLTKPIHIIHINSEGESASYPRNLVEIGEGAEAVIVERYVGDNDAAYQINALSEIKVADKGSLIWVKLQQDGEQAQHIGSTAVHLGEEVEFDHFTLNTGSQLSRSQVFVACAGENSKIGCRGVSMLSGKQHSDITLLVDHAVQACESREFYKSVVDDNAHSVFQGKIIVAPHAQKTDGQMMVQSLVLTDDAQVSVKPELEIFADDVQCAHGSTTGDIDEDLLFYLRARGIPEAQARQMLIIAFLSEVIEEIDNERVVTLLEDLVKEWLEAKKG
ncbi:Fe-S cluster assembly protein SufD [Rhodobacteraceae bacterium RKSG542]|uniref:Fe-S cluster assembly protein SufD n=1 Tax=Pseudovibrio flavus TaxID=2529854 RepID=UPI0012BBA089|nr:Fe-S cluster assembly protein SufD [Pseudovibrio flavus]MTI15792.1 Fe-S cluster assembly protein SufD [Pseudovibrio flavus]